MEPLVLVLMLILLQTLYFGIEAGRARQRLGIEAQPSLAMMNLIVISALIKIRWNNLSSFYQPF